MNNLNKGSRRLNPAFQVRMSGVALRNWMSLFAASMRESESLLTELDSAIGDGDHGANMRRGMDAVEKKLDELALADFSGQLRVISTTLMSSVGGASGPLFGAFFLQSSHTTQHKPELGLADLAAAMEAGYRGVVQLGKAEVGDKTMVDPVASRFLHALRSAAGRRQGLPECGPSCRRGHHPDGREKRPRELHRGAQRRDAGSRRDFRRPALRLPRPSRLNPFPDHHVQRPQP
jgi:dihydroxyacetone kinase-like protein